MLLEEELSAELSDEDATNLIRLLFASTRKAVLEKIVPASDNKKKYYTKAQKDVFEISKSDLTISMMRNYPQLPHKFMSDKAKIHHLLEIIVHINLERDSLKRQDQNFTFVVLLKKKAFLKHGVKEALRSRVKALNFCATLSCGELQDFALNKFKGI
uniref:Stromal antigen n=1 Tax=Solanum tuberosum TaxID=4113 RepID=M1BQ48_SOLTU